MVLADVALTRSVRATPPEPAHAPDPLFALAISSRPGDNSTTPRGPPTAYPAAREPACRPAEPRHEMLPLSRAATPLPRRPLPGRGRRRQRADLREARPPHPQNELLPLSRRGRPA